SLDPETGEVTFTPDPGFTGIGTFEYVVTDPAGNTSTTTVEVAVNPAQNLPPIANPDRATTPEDTPVTIDVVGNDIDEDGTLNPGSLTVTTAPENGEIAVDPETGDVTYTPDPGFNGTDSFIYTIEDNDGEVSNPTSVTVGVISVNEPPIADNINVAIAPGSTVPVPLTGSDSDGEVVSFRLESLPDRAEGSLLLNGEPVEAGQSLTPEEASQLQFQATVNFDGVGFTFSVTDNEGATSAADGTVSAILPPPNEPPIAENINVSLQPGDSAPVPLMGEDPDGTIASFTIESLPDRADGTLLLDGQPVEVGQVLTPEQGMLLRFQATGDFDGGDFTYSVTDNEGVTSIAEATAALIPLPLPNQAPTAFDDSGETPANTPIALNVVANDIDPDGTIDPTTIDLDPDTPGLQQTLTLGDRGTLIADDNGRVTFNPALGFQGTVKVPYTVRDDDGETSNPAEITIEIANAAPTAVDDSARTPFDTPVTFDITDNDTDPDGQIDPATVDLDPSTLAADSSFAIALQGEFEVDGEGNLTFTPVTGFSGTVTTPYTVRDDDGAISNRAEIAVTVEPFVAPPIPQIPFFGPTVPPTEPEQPPAEPNRPPVAEPDTVTTTENEPLTIPDSELLRNDRDPDGDPLRITDVGNPDNGTVTFNPDTGEIVFVPEPGFTGTATFEYTVTDENGNTSTARVEVNVGEGETEIPREDPDEDTDIPRQDGPDDCSCPPLPALTGVPLPVPPELIPPPGLIPVNGTPLNDVLIGGNADEVILAFGGNDFLQGNLGNDFLEGDAGDDILLAGQDNPLLPRDLFGQDSLDGGPGNDFLSANEADDILRAGDGNDVAYGGQNDDEIYGELGNDTLHGDNGNDTIIGTPGNLTVPAGQDADVLYGYRDNDLIQGGPGNDSIYGGKGDDFSYGGKDDDWMWGDLGADTLYGDDGNDTVFGDTNEPNQASPEGPDLLWGGLGNDFLSGNRNNDTLVGGDGEDTAYGGQEDDIVYGLTGNDLLYGDLGNDHVCGGEGDDTLFGDRDTPTPIPNISLQDTLSGGAGDDWLSANEGQDKLCGGEDNDTLYGGKDNDTLKGDAGDDWLFGDGGDDSLSGGAGSDRFVLFADGGTDTVADFLSGVDVIALGGGITFDQLTFTQAGTSAVVTLGSQQLAILEGVQATALTAGDFTAFPI
ncbi:Ig-like domain-containing protein, partial [Lyngbya sp. CCY1209]|uniref:Ig-like domain-containing protein n=1 Tax=Lyngbya sp. CCY1209 TaxID=2886103 RepID=UPI002D2177E2